MGEVAALSAAGLWAFASLLFTRLSEDHGPIVMNALKCIIAVVLMVITLAILEGVVWPTITAEDTVILAVSGLIGLSIGDTAYFNALTRIGPRRALLLTALVPPVTALLAWPTLGESFTAPMLIGMVLTLGGVAWVIVERVPTQSEQTETEAADARKVELAGIGFALVAVLCQSTGNVLTKLGGTDASAIGISVVRVLVGSVGLLVVVAARRRTAELVAPFRSSSAAARLFVATFAGTYLGIWMLNAGLKYTSHTGIAATLSSTSPIFILPLAWIALDERLTPRSVLGAFIAVIGVAVLFLI